MPSTRTSTAQAKVPASSRRRFVAPPVSPRAALERYGTPWFNLAENQPRTCRHNPYRDHSEDPIPDLDTYRIGRVHHGPGSNPYRPQWSALLLESCGGSPFLSVGWAIFDGDVDNEPSQGIVPSIVPREREAEGGPHDVLLQSLTASLKMALRAAQLFSIPLDGQPTVEERPERPLSAREWAQRLNALARRGSISEEAVRAIMDDAVIQSLQPAAVFDLRSLRELPPSGYRRTAAPFPGLDGSDRSAATQLSDSLVASLLVPIAQLYRHPGEPSAESLTVLDSGLKEVDRTRRAGSTAILDHALGDPYNWRRSQGEGPIYLYCLLPGPGGQPTLDGPSPELREGLELRRTIQRFLGADRVVELVLIGGRRDQLTAEIEALRQSEPDQNVPVRWTALDEVPAERLDTLVRDLGRLDFSASPFIEDDELGQFFAPIGVGRSSRPPVDEPWLLYRRMEGVADARFEPTPLLLRGRVKGELAPSRMLQLAALQLTHATTRGSAHLVLASEDDRRVVDGAALLARLVSSRSARPISGASLQRVYVRNGAPLAQGLELYNRLISGRTPKGHWPDSMRTYPPGTLRCRIEGGPHDYLVQKKSAAADHPTLPEALQPRIRTQRERGVLETLNRCAEILEPDHPLMFSGMEWDVTDRRDGYAEGDWDSWSQFGPVRDDLRQVPDSVFGQLGLDPLGFVDGDPVELIARASLAAFQERARSAGLDALTAIREAEVFEETDFTPGARRFIEFIQDEVIRRSGKDGWPQLRLGGGGSKVNDTNLAGRRSKLEKKLPWLTGQALEDARRMLQRLTQQEEIKLLQKTLGIPEEKRVEPNSPSCESLDAWQTIWQLESGPDELVLKAFEFDELYAQQQKVKRLVGWYFRRKQEMDKEVPSARVINVVLQNHEPAFVECWTREERTVAAAQKLANGLGIPLRVDESIDEPSAQDELSRLLK